MAAQAQRDQPHALSRNSPANSSIQSLEELGEISHTSSLPSTRQFIESISDPSPPLVRLQQQEANSSPYSFDASSSLLCSSFQHFLLSKSPRPSIPSALDNSPSIMLGTSADHNPSMLLQSYDDRITHLERRVCSGFFCCNIPLVDLHALINHYEDEHCPRRTSPGTKASRRRSSSGAQRRPFGPPRIDTNVLPFPSLPSTSPVSQASTPASSRCSSVVSSSPTPQTPLPLPGHVDSVAIANPDSAPVIEYNPYLGLAMNSSQAQPTPQHYAYVTSMDVISAFGPEYDFSRDYASYESAFVEQQKKELEEALEWERQQQAMQQQLDTPPSGEELDQFVDSPVQEEAPPLTPESDMSFSRASSSNLSEAKRKVSSKSRRETSVSSDAASSSDGGKVVKPRNKSSNFTPLFGPSTNTGNRNKREKQYKCSRPGCIKAYLNPNGLKYHLEKGTCQFDSAAVHRAASASPTTSETLPTVPDTKPPTSTPSYAFYSKELLTAISTATSSPPTSSSSIPPATAASSHSLSGHQTHGSISSLPTTGAAILSSSSHPVGTVNSSSFPGSVPGLPSWSASPTSSTPSPASKSLLVDGTSDGGVSSRPSDATTNLSHLPVSRAFTSSFAASL